MRTKKMYAFYLCFPNCSSLWSCPFLWSGNWASQSFHDLEPLTRELAPTTYGPLPFNSAGSLHQEGTVMRSYIAPQRSISAPRSWTRATSSTLAHTTVLWHSWLHFEPPFAKHHSQSQVGSCHSNTKHHVWCKYMPVNICKYILIYIHIYLGGRSNVVLDVVQRVVPQLNGTFQNYQKHPK